MVVPNIVMLICWWISVSKMLNSPWKSLLDWICVIVGLSKVSNSSALGTMILDNATSLETVRMTFFFQNSNCAWYFAMVFVHFGRLNCFTVLMAVTKSDAMLPVCWAGGWFGNGCCGW